MELKLATVEAMHKAAGTFVRSLIPKKDCATVVGLSGELGSGKTTFVGGVAKELGVTRTITSPTFVIQKTYPIKPVAHRQRTTAGGERRQRKQFQHLVHIDAYRLESADELLALGFRELVRDPRKLVLVEWPEHVRDALPRDTATLSFTVVDDTTRSIHQ